MARQQEEMRATIMRLAEALNNGGETLNTNLPGVIVNNPNDTLGTHNVIGNPGGARNGNLDLNVALNIQNGQSANLGGPANNQGILVVQVVGILLHLLILIIVLNKLLHHRGLFVFLLDM